VTPWKTIARREVLDLRPWLRVWLEDVQLPSGRLIQNFSRIETPTVVVIVALTANGELVIERSYKHGPRRVSLTLPGGYVEPGEEPRAAAQRELFEESGYMADGWVALGNFVTDSNRQGGHVYLFLARDARRIQPPDAGDLEEIEISLMPLDEAVAASRTGAIADVSSVAAIGLAVATLRFNQR
jgi:ADP-ribose pyrophosphatase